MPLVDIGIEKALSFIGQVSNEQFINDVQMMLFKVSPRIESLDDRLPKARSAGEL